MTGNDIKSEFYEALRTTEDATRDTAILRQINRALDIIAFDGPPNAGPLLPEIAISVVPDTRVYPLPAGVRGVQDCYIDGVPIGLTRLNPHEVYAAGQLIFKGLPRYFWEDGENIYLHPMPASNYTLYVLATGAIPHLTALTDTLELRAAGAGPPAIAATPLAPAYCNAIPEFVKYRILENEKGDYAQIVASAKENWGALLKKAWDLDLIRYARRYSGKIRPRMGSLPNSFGYGIPGE